MIYLYGMSIPKVIAQCDFTHMMSVISKERQVRISKYYFDIDKKRALFAEILLRYILDIHLSIRKCDLSFEKNQFGKPMLSDYPHVFFNYSHSGDWVVCAVGERRLGVDVEIIKTRDVDIAKHFFSKKEYECLQSMNKEKQNECFYKLWTLKESFIKAEGKGLTIPLDSFSFKLKNKIELIIEEQLINNYFFWSGKLDNSHAVALCYDSLENNQTGITITAISYKEILDWFKTAMFQTS